MALAAVENAVAVNPDLRLNSVRDRFYKAIKSTPYSSRRIVIQAVSYDEVAHWCQLLLKVTPSKSIKLPERTRKAVHTKLERRGIRIPDTVATFYHDSFEA